MSHNINNKRVRVRHKLTYLAFVAVFFNLAISDQLQAKDTMPYAPLADLALTMLDRPSSVTANDTFTYSLEMTNYGPSTAVNVIVEDIVPAGSQIVSVSTSGSGVCHTVIPSVATLPSTCMFDTLSGGESHTITIVVDVDPGVQGVLQNSATVSSDTFDNYHTNDLAPMSINVNSEADLIVTKSDSSDPVMAGHPLTYTIDVTNNGPSTSHDVLLTDTLAAETSFVSASTIDGDPCHLADLNIIECKLGSIAPNENVTVIINAEVTSAVVDETSIENTVNVTSASYDPDDAYYIEHTLVSTSADLWIDKKSNFLAATSSDTLSYFLTVHNEPGCSNDTPQICGKGGPSDAINVVVTNTLPQPKNKVAVEFISDSCTYDSTPHAITCTVPILPTGSKETFDIQLLVKGGIAKITNSSEVRSDTPDPVSENNTD
jgi:uncharacterized repeat protein (TIGR01451 family)